MTKALACLTVACFMLAGCALTSRSHPRELRYFTPEAADRITAHPTGQPRGELRIGHVTAGSHLRFAIVHRDSAVEVEPYNTLRWTELPDAYVRHALLRALFEDRPLAQAVSGNVPTLDVEVIAFEQIAGVRPAGRVTLGYVLQDDKQVIQRGTITVEKPAVSAQIEPVVAAIQAAMLDATAQLADRVTAAVEQVAAR